MSQISTHRCSAITSIFSLPWACEKLPYFLEILSWRDLISRRCTMQRQFEGGVYRDRNVRAYTASIIMYACIMHVRICRSLSTPFHAARAASIGMSYLKYAATFQGGRISRCGKISRKYSMHEISGWSQCTIAIMIATWTRPLLASMPVSHFRLDSRPFVKHRPSYTEPVTLLPQLSCLLQIESMHDQANSQPRHCVATFSGACLDASALWHASVQNKLPGHLLYMTARI